MLKRRGGRFVKFDMNTYNETCYYLEGERKVVVTLERIVFVTKPLYCSQFIFFSKRMDESWDEKICEKLCGFLLFSLRNSFLFLDFCSSLRIDQFSPLTFIPKCC